jgi:hypothetical protein
MGWVLLLIFLLVSFAIETKIKRYVPCNKGIPPLMISIYFRHYRIDLHVSRVLQCAFVCFFDYIVVTILVNASMSCTVLPLPPPEVGS